MGLLFLENSKKSEIKKTTFQKNKRTKSKFDTESTLHESAKIRSLICLLILIIPLILTLFICMNISRQKNTINGMYNTTEPVLGFQASNALISETKMSASNGYFQLPKFITIGLIGKIKLQFANIFYLLNYLNSSIYFTFLRFSGLFYLWLKDFVFSLPNVRKKMMIWVSPFITSPESFLLNGMVFGDDHGMPEMIRHRVNVIGMQHVMAASGFNVALILSLTKNLIRRFCPPIVTALFCLLAICGYVALIGAPASAVRAGLMVSYGLIAVQFLRRQVTPWYSLAVCAVLMLLCNHEYLDSISFQLSVTATLGIILIEPVLTGKTTWFGSLNAGNEAEIDRFPVFQIVKDSTVTSVAAQAFSLPLLLYHFGELSSLSLLANVVLLWMTPLITVSGIFLVILASFSQFFPLVVVPTMVFGKAVEILCAGFLYLVELLGQAEWSLLHLPFSVPIWAVFLWWIMLCIWLFWTKKGPQA